MTATSSVPPPRKQRCQGGGVHSAPRGFLTMRCAVLLLAVALSCSRDLPPKASPPPPLPDRDLKAPPPPPEVAVRPAESEREEAAFRVLVARPQGRLLGGVHVTLTFSEPVVALATLSQQDPASSLQLQPPVKGHWHWLGSSSVEFLNDEPLPYSTAFHLVVPQGFKSLDGAKLAQAFQLDFTTPTPEVDGYAVEPSAHDCAWSRPDQHFRVLVSQPLADPAGSFFFEVGEAKKRVAAKVAGAVHVADEPRPGARRPRVDVAPMLAFKDERTRYEIAPAESIAMDTPFSVGLSGDARGAEGTLTAGREWRMACATPGPMRIKAVARCSESAEYHCPSGPLVFRFTNPVASRAALAKLVHLTPDPQLDFGDESSPPSTDVRASGKLRPGRTYAIHIDAGVQDTQGHAAPAFDGSVTMDDLLPSLYVGGEKALLEADGDGQLPAQVTNLAALEADLWHVSPTQMARAELCASDKCSNLPGFPPDAALRLKLEYPRNEPRLHGVDLRAALNGAKTGLVVARLRAPATDFEDRPLRVYAQLTDLAVHAKLGATSGLAWVNSVSTARPVARAAVQVFDRDGEKVAEAVTDAQGVAVLPGYDGFTAAHSEYDAPHLLVSATAGDDTGYVTSEGYDELVAPDISRDFGGGRTRGQGLVFADRGIYRPGDTAHLKGIVRQRVKGELATPPEGTRVRVEVKDPDEKTVLQKEVALSAFGGFTLDVPVAREARLGNFYVTVRGVKELQYAYGGYRVAEYRAPQFRVDVVTAAPAIFAGEELKGSVVARYLFGGAMDRAQASWSVQRTSDSFTPPRNDAFNFGRQTWLWDDGEPARDSGVFASGQGEIDSAGNLQVAAGKVEAMADRPARYTLEAEVADVSRQRVAGRAAVLVHPADFYVGLGKIDLFARVGQELKLPVVAAKPDGARVSAAVHVSLLQRSWHAVRQKGVNGVYQTVSEPVEEKAAECDVKTGDAPQECRLAVPKPGFYILRGEARDAAGRLALSTVSLYGIGAGAASWLQTDTPRVDVVADKTEYQVGDTAHLLVKSPYPECEALVSVEREGTSDQRVLHLSGGAVTVDVGITEAMVPNAFVGIVLQRGRVGSGKAAPEGDDPGRPSARLGYAELSVGKAPKRLAVAITTPRAEYKPRETVAIDVAVTDAAQKPAEAEVQLYVVDEAVLRLTSYELPDALAALFPKHGLSISIGEPLARLVRRQRFGEKGEVVTGGGGGLEASADVRSKFVTTVDWRTVVTDAAGHAHADVVLPDNLTSFRILAVAATKGDRFGGGQATIRVALPLLVLPALPRFARLGDEFEAGVVVHSLQAAEVDVAAQVSGGVELLKPSELRASVEAGVAKEVRFKLRATAPGKATLRFRASAGALSDAVEQTIPIELPVGMEAVAIAGDVAGTADARPQPAEALATPNGVRPGIGGLELQLSSTALAGLQEGMEQLIDYPYGCIEQLSSRLVPFVALREVSRVFGVEPPGLVKDPDEVVRSTVAKIEAQQAPSGGFYYWPTPSCPYAWPSIYATLALHRARELGYPVSKQVLDKARSFLAEKAAGQGGCQWEKIGPETRIFALQVLARMGDPKPSYYDELYAGKDKLPLFAKALLADAMGLGKGGKPRAMALLQEVINSARETTREVHFEDNDAISYAPLLSSDTRTTGMVLQTLVDLQPGHPFVSKIARYLSNVRKGGRYRTTQEAAYALMGLAEVVRVKERAAPDFVAKVMLGDSEFASKPFKGRSLEVVSRTVPMEELLARKGTLPLRFVADGTGSLYYTALLRYAPEKLPMEPLNQGIFVQRWFEPYEQAGKLATDFNAGELVRVQLRIATSQERNFVAIEVPLPAGLEAVDTALATTKQSTRRTDEEEGSESMDETEADSFWSPFVYSEKRDDRVVYFSDLLPPGVHSQTFVARATTPGKFLLKPARAEEMYAPEVFGRSEGGSVTVTAARPLAQR